MQLHKNGVVAAFAGGKHLQAGFIRIIATGGDDFDRNAVVRAGKGVIAIDFPIETEGIAAIQIRIAVLVRTVVFIKDQRCKLAVHFGIFRATLCNFSVDLLLLIGQEDIVVT